MTNFTLNNHLTYSIGGRSYAHRETPIEKYKVSLGAVDPERYKVSNYAEELHRTARTVYSEFGNDLVLFLSGGTDSEIVLRNFLAVGHRPHCVVLKFKNDYNIDDVKEAEEISRELDVKLDVIDFDVEDFFYSGQAKEFGNQVDCSQITYNMVYYNVLKLGAPAVMGGEALLTRQVNRTDSFWYYTFRENEDASAMRFTNKFGIPLVNEWFSYTPELLLYYLEDPDIQKLVTNKFNYKLSSVFSKNAILAKLYPSIRYKKKTHGFENLLAFNFESYKAIGADSIKRLESSVDGIPIDLALQQLRGQM
jgi:hypothetical protein